MPKADRKPPQGPKATLTSDILAGVMSLKRGPSGWFSRLPADVQAEVNAVRERFAAGEIQATKYALAKSIHAALAARGLIAIGWKEVVRWLGDST